MAPLGARAQDSVQFLYGDLDQQSPGNEFSAR